MTAAVSVSADVAVYEAAQRQAEAAEAERAAFAAWEHAYGAYEVARDECSAALRRTRITHARQ